MNNLKTKFIFDSTLYDTINEYLNRILSSVIVATIRNSSYTILSIQQHTYKQLAQFLIFVNTVAEFREIYFCSDGYYILFQKLVYETVIYYYNVRNIVYYYYKSDSDTFIVRRAPALYYTTALKGQVLNHQNTLSAECELMGRFHIRFANPTALLLKWSIVKCSFPS